MPFSLADPVPVFKLYGETSGWPTPDLLHCESIAERSRLHGWRISPHRHGDLAQLLYVQSGLVELDVEGVAHQVAGPVLQVVPALCVHGFAFSRDVRGHVLTLAPPLVEQLAPLLEGAPLARPARYAVGLADAGLDALFETLAREYRRPAPGRELMLRALASQLLVALSRLALASPEAPEPQPERAREHLGAFVRLVERDFRLHLPIEHYAASLGIGAAHLNALCRRLAGQSALQVVNQRLLLEAKRCLVYTAMTVNQVADVLGFSEPAYFSRFFKRGTGLSPRAFRARR